LFACFLPFAVAPDIVAVVRAATLEPFVSATLSLGVSRKSRCAFLRALGVGERQGKVELEVEGTRVERLSGPPWRSRLAYT